MKFTFSPTRRVMDLVNVGYEHRLPSTESSKMSHTTVDLHSIALKSRATHCFRTSRRFAFLGTGLVFFLAGWTFCTTPVRAQTATTTTLAATATPPFTSPIGIGQASDGNFYSVSGPVRPGCPDGSNNVCAFIYKITPSGTVSAFHTFQEVPPSSYYVNSDGLEPSALLEGADGNFYGACEGGGAYGEGTIFKIAPDGTFTTLYVFQGTANSNGGITPVDGYSPNTLIQGSDGSLYGTARMAPTSSLGQYPINSGSMLFQITPTGAFTVIHRFLTSIDSSGNGTAPEGWNPSSIVQGDNGDFYITMSGSAAVPSSNGNGSINEVSSNGSVTILYTFPADGSQGASPIGPLVEGSDGSMYGTTSANQILTQNNVYQNVAEFVYQLTRSGGVVDLHQFTGGSDGTDFPGGLLLASDGNLYGTTIHGGNTTASNCTHTATPGCGTIFQLQPAGALTTLHTFIGGLATSQTPAPPTDVDGAHPQMPIVQTQSGVFFGTTSGDTVKDSNGNVIQNNSSTIYSLSLTNAIPAPVQLSFSVNGQTVSSVLPNTAVTLTWKVLNAFSATAQQCHASVQGNPIGAGQWSGPQTGTRSGIVYTGTATITPSVGGIYTYVLNCGGVETGMATLTVSGVTITTTTLPDGVVSIPYNVAVQAVGGTTPYIWGASGTLPPGISIATTASYATVDLVGTPNQFGKYQVALAVQDSSNPAEVGLQTSTVNIASGLLLAGSLNNGTVGTAYNATATATGGISPYRWGLTSGKLPDGLTLNTTSGVVTGTPTASGNYTFSITVTDAEGMPATFTQTYTVSTVVPPLAIVHPAWPACTVEVMCNGQYVATGGKPPYTWSIAPGTIFPPGLTLSTSGALSGLPTQYNTLPAPIGNFGNFLSVQVTDSSSPPVTAGDVSSLDIVSGLKIVSIPLPTAMVGAPYQAPQPIATGGVPPYKWQIDAGQAPQVTQEYGVSPATGALYSVGTGPVSAGIFQLLYTVTDSETTPAATANMAATLTVVPAQITSVTTLSSSTSNTGTGMNIALTATVTAAGQTPTGIVTFYNGSTSLGTATLGVTGTAAITTSFSSSGVYNLTAVYAGAGAIAGSTSAPIPETIVTPALSASVSPGTLTIASGSSGTLIITVTPTGGYTGSVSLSCGTLPAHVSCTFTPPSLNIPAGSGPVTDTLTINTAAQITASMFRPKYGLKTPEILIATVFVFPTFLLAGLGSFRRRHLLARRLFLFAFLCLGLVGTSILNGCGGNNNTAPKGAYTVPITLTLAGGTTQTINARITVN